MHPAETPPHTGALEPRQRTVLKRELNAAWSEAFASMTLARIISLNLLLLGLDVIGHISLHVHL
jgi:hypothetical protein